MHPVTDHLPWRPVLLSVVVWLTPLLWLCVLPVLCFPPTDSYARQPSPFPTRRLPRVGSPPFQRYYEAAKTSAARYAALRIPSSHAYFPSSVSFRSLRVLGVSLPLRLGVGRPVSPLLRLSCWGRSQTDLSSSQGTLRCLCPALRPRSDLHAKPVAAFRCCPRCSDYEGSNVDHCFEAQSHGFGIRSIRFVPTSLPTTQCSLLVGG